MLFYVIGLCLSSKMHDQIMTCIYTCIMLHIEVYQVDCLVFTFSRFVK